MLQHTAAIQSLSRVAICVTESHASISGSPFTCHHHLCRHLLPPPSQHNSHSPLGPSGKLSRLPQAQLVPLLPSALDKPHPCTPHPAFSLYRLCPQKWGPSVPHSQGSAELALGQVLPYATYTDMTPTLQATNQGTGMLGDMLKVTQLVSESCDPDPGSYQLHSNARSRGVSGSV